MRNPFPAYVEASRVLTGSNRSEPYDRFGAFLFRRNSGQWLRVIVCEDGHGWDHVSVSLAKRCPTWDEMCWVKNLFWRPDECVVQFHPPAADHINYHSTCLHLWRRVDGDFPMPPKECV